VSLHPYETRALIITVIAVLLIFIEEATQKIEVDSRMHGKVWNIYGSFKATDLLLALSNIPMALYAIGLAKSIRDNVYVLMYLLFFITAINVTGAVLLEKATFDTNNKTGLIGFLDSDSWFIAIFLMGFLGTIVNAAGYLLAMQYVRPVISLQATALEPTFASIITAAW
jgi:drug/metabolite transporter (DMT)-like permease